jgi:hypothetical protein
MKLRQFEILNHGPDQSDYFQGCGTSCSNFTHAFTGIGDNAKEAYQDALEQVYMTLGSGIGDRLPSRPSGIRVRDKVPANSEGCYWYTSIRLEVKQ